jgi:hypothetical protein
VFGVGEASALMPLVFVLDCPQVPAFLDRSVIRSFLPSVPVQSIVFPDISKQNFSL